MKIDLAILAIILIFGGLGMWSGAIRQVAHLGGLLVGWFVAQPLANHLAPIIAPRLGYPLLVTSVGCNLILFFLLYLISSLIFRSLLRAIFPSGEHGCFNRLCGFAMGAAKAAIICLIVLCAALFAQKTVSSLWSGWPKIAGQSRAVHFARRHNVFARLPQLKELQELLRFKGPVDPPPAEANPTPRPTVTKTPMQIAIEENPELRDLMADNGKLGGLAKDAKVQQALESGDWSALLSISKVMDALNDPQILQGLSKLSLGQISTKPAPDQMKPGTGPSKSPTKPSPNAKYPSSD